jgi:hypothetical protein
MIDKQRKRAYSDKLRKMYIRLFEPNKQTPKNMQLEKKQFVHGQIYLVYSSRYLSKLSAWCRRYLFIGHRSFCHLGSE